MSKASVTFENIADITKTVNRPREKEIRNEKIMNKAPSRQEMVKTIAEFIELGHVENIVSLFKQEKEYYQYVGELIRDDRFMVRMGLGRCCLKNSPP